MKKIMILRHGKSEVVAVTDIDRNLTTQGEKDVLKVSSKLMSTEGWKPELVICSDAKRAEQTKNLFLSNFVEKVPILIEHKLYSGDSNDILCLLSQQDPAISQILLVGHNPLLSQLASHLCFQQITLGTSDCLLLSRETSSWEDVFAKEWRLHHRLNKYRL